MTGERPDTPAEARRRAALRIAFLEGHLGVTASPTLALQIVGLTVAHPEPSDLFERGWMAGFRDGRSEPVQKRR